MKHFRRDVWRVGQASSLSQGCKEYQNITETQDAEGLEAGYRGLVRPARAFDELATKPAPWWGLGAVLIRFLVTTLTTTLALLLLGKTPFQPSYLTFLPTENYYQTLVFLFPFFGLAAWLLMSGWLSNFAYRIRMPFLFFLLSGLLALGVTLLTVSLLTIKASLADPVKSLRYE